MSDYKPREWDWIVNTTVKLPEGMKNWPASVQDKIYADLEARSKTTGEQLYISQSRIGIDPETGPFIHLRIKNLPPWTELKTTELPN